MKTTKMKAENYITQWCDKTYKGGKELDDWTTKEVMQFANDFANEKNDTFLKEAIIIMQNLLSYGRIHTITGVRYTEGTHKEILDMADNWLNKNRQN